MKLLGVGLCVVFVAGILGMVSVYLTADTGLRPSYQARVALPSGKQMTCYEVYIWESREEIEIRDCQPAAATLHEGQR